MIEELLKFFVLFFVIVEPISLVPLFAAMTEGADETFRRRMALRAVLIAGTVFALFAIGGAWFLQTMGISVAAFRIAGGIMLFLIALEMVFEKRTERREDRAAKVASDPEVEDVSIFPMAMPMIAGPGSIASVMLLMSRNSGIERSLVVLGAMVTILLLTLVALLAAGPIMRILGAKIEAVITRLLGVLLAALAVQFVIDGLTEVLR